MQGDLGAMMARHFKSGRVEGIYLRPERRTELVSVPHAEVSPDGIEGDHSRAGKRAVTLIQAEHLPVISALLGGQQIEPRDLRRNILISGINLLALRKTHVEIGGCTLYIHGPCPPCSRMEETFGPGGYSAVRGHGGVYAEVTSPGALSLHDSVTRAVIA